MGLEQAQERGSRVGVALVSGHEVGQRQQVRAEATLDTAVDDEDVLLLAVPEPQVRRSPRRSRCSPT